MMEQCSGRRLDVERMLAAVGSSAVGGGQCGSLRYVWYG